MSEAAIVGSPPGLIPTANVAQWIFSQPFGADGSVTKNAPSPRAAAHRVSPLVHQKPLFVDPTTNAQLDWAKAQRDALRVAQGLRELGLRPSDGRGDAVVSPVVLVHLPNCVQYAPILYGIFAAGLTATTANPALTPAELEWIMRESRPQVVITTVQGFESIKTANSALYDGRTSTNLVEEKRVFLVDPSQDHYGIKEADDARHGERDWKMLLRDPALPNPVEFTEQECRTHVALILWSSGTTGRSKGTLISHHALVAGLTAVWHTMSSYGGEERWIGSPPFYHVFGLVHVLLLAPCCGATVFTMQKFEPQKMLQLIQKHRITYLHVGPPVGLFLAKSPMLEGVDFTSVKGILSGGAPVGAEVLQTVYERLGIFMYMGYGSSEAGGIANQMGTTWKEYKEELGGAGEPLYGVELRIISIDEPRETLKRGQKGEIMVRCPALFLGYLNNEQAALESFDRDGWLHSGDVGRIDGQGRLFITDRLKEVIKVKGFQVAPSELEAVLCSSPLVVDAGVTSIYDEGAASEFPRAYVVPSDKDALALCEKGSSKENPPEVLVKFGAEIKSWMEQRTVEYKHLRGNLVFVQEIPRSPAGKILRRLLKETEGIEVHLYPKAKKDGAAKL